MSDAPHTGAAPDDGEAIERALLSLYERWQTSGLPDQPTAREFVLQHYSRRRLARDLAAVLDDAAHVTPKYASAGGEPVQAGQATPLGERLTQRDDVPRGSGPVT